MRPLQVLTIFRLFLEAANEFILSLHEHVSAHEDKQVNK